MSAEAATGTATTAPSTPPRVPPAIAAMMTRAPGTSTAAFMIRGLSRYASTCMYTR